MLKKFRTGQGHYLDIALVEVMVEFLGNHDIYQAMGVCENGIPEIRGTRISYAIYETKDGRYMTLAALEEKFWQNFCDFANKPDWLEWAEKSVGSLEHREIMEFFKSKNWCEWYEISLQVDACLAPVLKAHERHEHPFFIKRNKVKM